jgi:hypothetical protein
MVATMAAQSRRAPKTRADYTRIYTRFIDWLAGQLGRPPQAGDLTEVALLAWRNQRGTSGGRGGQGLAASSLRTELAALRVLARKAGRQPALALELALPRHTPAPPATISHDEYDRLLRMPDQRRSAAASAGATRRSCRCSATPACARQSCAACAGATWSGPAGTRPAGRCASCAARAAVAAPCG